MQDMASWNQRFFIPSVLLTGMVLSGAVLAQPQPQLTPDEETVRVFLPQIEERAVALAVSGEVQPRVDAQTAEVTPQPEETFTPSEPQQPQVMVVATEVSTEAATTPEVTPVPEEIVEAQPTTISVKLLIKGPGISKSGKITVEPNSTVYQVMKKGSHQLDFSLKTAQHNSLGIFVEGIAGVMNNPKANAYWLYYVNGQFASRGVSLQTVQEGDTITWSYE